MPELRHDPIQKRWVIIATERGRRPSDFLKVEESAGGGFCPFDMGNEDKTPPEVMAFRPLGTAPNTPGWEVRVVSNKFPALRIEGDLDRAADGLYDKMNGIGAHEVIIESPSHDLSLADQPLEQLEKVILAAQMRLNDLLNDLRFRYVLIFKNHGTTAGASLAHPHIQIIATPVTPRTVAMELDSCREHYHVKERCLICDIISQEIKQEIRIVNIIDGMIAFTPFASRFPFEVFIAPIQHSHSFSELSAEGRTALARIMKDVLTRLKLSLNDPPYNFMLHTSPNMQTKGRRPGYWQTLPFDYHWHFEITPRLVKIAGFEWGTGFYINPTPPEEAARYLREVELKP